LVIGDWGEKGTSNIEVKRSEVRGQRSEVRGQRSEVRGQRSEVRGQRSEVRGQRSEARSHPFEFMASWKGIIGWCGKTDFGRLGKKHRMEPHPNKVIAKNAGIHAVVQALDPSPRFLIVVNLMFGSTPFSLRFPLVPKLIFVEDVAVLFGPISQSFASGSVDGAETGQLPEVLRELRDFR
jgi:hypothetical protein